MAPQPAPTALTEQGLEKALRNWTMTALTLVFVLLYGAALLGWIKPLADERMITRLEPLILVIIGYYFGRLPAQQNEQTLKEELARQEQIAIAAQHSKEQMQQARETLEEKLKNVRAALTQPAAPVTEKSGQPREEPLRHAIAVALKILHS
jgi:hypothetical protein